VRDSFDAAVRALASIEDLSEAERAAIVALLKIGRGGGEPGDEASARPLTTLADRAFRWAEFDRWHAFFTASGAFPARWDGLHVAPTTAAPPAAHAAYHQRKLDLLLEWLDMLTRRASELGRYTRRGLRVRIVRQEDRHRCPVCESFTSLEVRHGSDAVPPLHPGCRCVLMAVTTVPPHDPIGRRGAHRSRAHPLE
jgi:hypothetical protein